MTTGTARTLWTLPVGGPLDDRLQDYLAEHLGLRFHSVRSLNPHTVGHHFVVDDETETVLLRVVAQPRPHYTLELVIYDRAAGQSWARIALRGEAARVLARYGPAGEIARRPPWSPTRGEESRIAVARFLDTTQSAVATTAHREAPALYVFELVPELLEATQTSALRGLRWAGLPRPRDDDVSDVVSAVYVRLASAFPTVADLPKDVRSTIEQLTRSEARRYVRSYFVVNLSRGRILSLESIAKYEKAEMFWTPSTELDVEQVAELHEQLNMVLRIAQSDLSARTRAAFEVWAACDFDFRDAVGEMSRQGWERSRAAAALYDSVRQLRNHPVLRSYGLEAE